MFNDKEAMPCPLLITRISSKRHNETDYPDIEGKLGNISYVYCLICNKVYDSLLKLICNSILF